MIQRNIINVALNLKNLYYVTTDCQYIAFFVIVYIQTDVEILLSSMAKILTKEIFDLGPWLSQKKKPRVLI